MFYTGGMPNFTRPPLADREVLLDAWVAKRAEIARLEAEAADLLATRAALFDQDVAAHPVHRDMTRRSMIAEYSAAGRVGSGTVENAFADAETLTMYFPGLHDALRKGTISAQHVRAIIAASDPVRDAVRNRRIGDDSFPMYEQACIAVAEQGLARPHSGDRPADRGCDRRRDSGRTASARDR